MSRVNEPLNPPEAHVLQPWVAHIWPGEIRKDYKSKAYAALCQSLDWEAYLNACGKTASNSN